MIKDNDNKILRDKILKILRSADSNDSKSDKENQREKSLEDRTRDNVKNKEFIVSKFNTTVSNFDLRILKIEKRFHIAKTSISAVFILALMSITAYKILQSCWYGTFIQDYHDLVGWILKPIADFSKLIESDARFIAIMVIILGIFSAKAIAIIIKYSGIKNLVNLADKVKK